MKAAFATWEERIAPVFDVSRTLRVVEVEDDRIVRETRKTIEETAPARKALFLAELGIDTLVCGAISMSFYEQIVSHEIRIISFVSGEFRKVVTAWMEGALNTDAFAMPGCCGRRRRGSGTSGTMIMEGFGMKGRGRGGTGRGGGRAQGRAVRSGGRMGGPKAAGPAGDCVCPVCGQRDHHEPGIPCIQRKCPKCGSAMTRE